MEREHPELREGECFLYNIDPNDESTAFALRYVWTRRLGEVTYDRSGKVVKDEKFSHFRPLFVPLADYEANMEKYDRIVIP